MHIHIDSRNINDGDWFYCLEKDLEKAQKYIYEAKKKGASQVFTTHKIDGTKFVDNINISIGESLRTRYNNLPKYISTITGTNGKTSTAYFAYQILKNLNIKSLYIGTIGVITNDDEMQKSLNRINYEKLTTPSITSIFQLLECAKSYGCDYVFIEASSHGISQGRLNFLPISSAGFTNFTQDHLDYHSTMNEYFEAKLSLFTKLLYKNGTAVVNIDDPKSQDIIASIPHNKVITYGTNGDIKLLDCVIKDMTQHIMLKYLNIEYSFKTSIIGEFQIYNILCAIGILISQNIEILQIINILEFIKAPPGRLEKVLSNNTSKNVYVDYAHTPDALEKAILEARKFTDGKIITVFGCGGNRDDTKRKIMGKISVQHSNFTIITDDNPRNESAENIRKQIIEGIIEYKQQKLNQLKEFPNKRIMLFALESENFIGNFVEITTGRLDAIKYAIDLATEKDIVLICGKGHEDYQIIGDIKYEFSDYAEARKILG